MRKFSVATIHKAPNGDTYDKEVGNIIMHDSGKIFLHLHMFPDTFFKVAEKFNRTTE